MANRLLSCNINNLETEPQFEQWNVVSSDTETTPEQPIYDEQIYEVWGEATYGELISNQDNLGSEQGIDYTHLRDLLVAGRLSEADEETLDISENYQSLAVTSL